MKQSLYRYLFAGKEASHYGLVATHLEYGLLIPTSRCREFCLACIGELVADVLSPPMNELLRV